MDSLRFVGAARGGGLFTCVTQHLESLWDLITEYISEGLTRLRPDCEKKKDGFDISFFQLRFNQDQIQFITVYFHEHF